jgi:hypothetical protein
VGAGPEDVGTERAGGSALVWTSDPLCVLLDELRGEGFSIGVGEYLEAQEAAAACHRDGLGHDPHRLRNYLAPVLCKSFEQQQIFYRRFDTWWVDRAGGQKEELPEQPLPPPPLQESELGEVVRRTRPWKWWAASALGAAVVIAALVWWADRSGEVDGAGPVALPAPAPTQPITSTRTGQVQLGIRLRRLNVDAQVADLEGHPLPGAKVRRHAFGDLIATLEGHASAINGASFSPDGTRIATASNDNTARVWSRGEDGSWHSVVLQGHQSPVNSASFSPDATRIVTASDDRTARIWSRSEDGTWHSVVLQGHQNWVNSASFSPDGIRIVTASNDRTARVWDAETGEPLAEPLPHVRTVVSAWFTPDGQRLVTSSEDNTARIWDVATGQPLGEPLTLGPRDFFTTFGPHFSADGTRMVTLVPGGEAHIWSAFPPSDPRTLPVLGMSDERGKIGLTLDKIPLHQTLYFSHPSYSPPPPFTLPANTVRGTLEVKLAPLTFWERLVPHQRKVQAGLALLPLVLTGPWLAWRVRRRRQLVLERRATPEEQAVASPSLPEPDHELYRGAGFARARVEAQRRQRVGAGDLDPDATVEATVRRLGFFTPVYRGRLEPPVYLVLVDRIGIRDQRARMVDEILDRLQAGNVDLVRYDFDRDPRRASLRFSGGAHRDLEELAGLHPNHRLAIFTDGAGFIDPLTGRLAAWIRLFSAWPERILLTPVPLDHWNRRELDLTATGFAVLPASEAGIERLANVLRTEEVAVPSPPEETWNPPYPDLLAARPGRFLERHAPEESELADLCEQLAFYLGPDGYRWLCSLAVYPELDWYFTLYLGLLLRRFDGRKILAETTLMALTRLPWLRYGSMPDWLRLRLLQDLSEDDEKEVREWMRQFLEQREIPGSRFRLDVARPPESEARGLHERLRHWIEKADWRRLIKDLAQAEPREGALRDQIFVSFLLGKKPSRLQMVAPRAWRRWVWEQGLSTLGPRTGSVLVLTALVPILGLVLGGPGLEWLARNRSFAKRSSVSMFQWVDGGPGSAIPPGAFTGGFEFGHDLIVCRGSYRGGVHPGKIVNGNCNFGWGGKEIVQPRYEVMVARPDQFEWRSASRNLLPANAVIVGYEPGHVLYLCRSPYQGGLHPGKVVAGHCYFGWGGEEIVSSAYEVLTPREGS